MDDLEHELTVRNGTVVTGGGECIADIGIDQGEITSIAVGLRPGRQDVDASGLIVAPGAIDPHTHFAIYSGRSRTQSVDDYEVGSRAALLGGITTFINCTFQQAGEELDATVERELRLAAPSHADYAFHVALTDPSVRDLEGQLERLAERGHRSVKVFTSLPPYMLDDESLLSVLSAAARIGLVVNVHVEDHSLCTHLTSNAMAEGRGSVAHYASARPPAAEGLAVQKVAAYARAVGATVYFIYLSCEIGVQHAVEARRAGTDVLVETRPLYLFLNDSRYALPAAEANRYVCLPPLRSAADQQSLWRSIRDGEVATYATDHVAWTSEQKGLSERPFNEIPAGVSNVQTSVGMLYAEGVVAGRISMSRFVDVTATNPAKIFGLWPRKGAISVGADADLVLYDPNKEFEVHRDVLVSNADFDLFEGRTLTGWSVMTISQGEVVVREGHLSSTVGRGRFLQERPATVVAR